MELVEHHFKPERSLLEKSLFSVTALCPLVGVVTATEEICTHLILLMTSLWTQQSYHKTPGTHTHTHTHRKHSLKNTLLVFHPSVSPFFPRHSQNTRLFCFCPNSGEIPTRSKRGRRRTKEKHVGIFFPSQIFRVSQQQLHRSVTRCFPTLSDQKTTYLHKVSLSFRIGKYFLFHFFFRHHVSAVLRFLDGFWTKYFEDDDDEAPSAHEPTAKRSLWGRKTLKSQLRGYFLTAAFGFCNLILSLSLDCELSSITFRKTHTLMLTHNSACAWTHIHSFMLLFSLIYAHASLHSKTHTHTHHVAVSNCVIHYTAKTIQRVNFSFSRWSAM